ncbi:nucleoside transporter [Streptomyces albus]|uniref:N-acetylmuramoyl-L-alanine amidase n=1 Tax=Streptomyces albus TaxID=1888 RepID=A0A8H1L3F0_9ACTN|nr:nucleoside transporter [Streptomyces albus]
MSPHTPERGRSRPRTVTLSLAVAAVALATGLTGPAATATPPVPGEPGPSMNESFATAAEEYGVPRDVLAAVAYGETHFDGHAGKPSQAGGYGVMHLVGNPARHTLRQAARLTGEPVSELRRDTDANIHGGAAVLRAHADSLGMTRTQRRDVDAWYPAVARYSGARGGTARLYADTVYDLLAHGVRGTAPDGERITVPARDVHPDKQTAGAAPEKAPRSPDYPDAAWVPADPANYAEGRAEQLDKIVIHVTQGSYAGSISWFQNPEAKVSAHYVVRSSDGDITQMVRDADTAYHAKSANASSLGIEHEGYIDDPSWFTDAMYRSSAALTRHLADKHGIPLDRQHIIGHSEAPGNDHTDPGEHWDWDTYMELVREG